MDNNGLIPDRPAGKRPRVRPVRIAVAVVALLALLAAGGWVLARSPEASAKIDHMTGADLKPLREHFDKDLHDYPTARFRDVHFEGEGLYISGCGMVNARNAMGAYVGWRRFFVSQVFLNISDDGDDAAVRKIDDDFYKGICPKQADGRDRAKDLVYRPRR